MIEKRPLHLWVIGILALLWNCIGALDYVMTKTKNAAYLEQFTDAQLDYFYNLPTWFVIFWALAIWSSVLASILLLFRKKLSSSVYLISLIGVIITFSYSYGISNGYEIVGGQPTSLIMPAMVFIIAVALFFYTRAMSSKGILK